MDNSRKQNKIVLAALIGCFIAILGLTIGFVVSNKSGANASAKPKMVVDNGIIVKNVNGKPTVVDKLDKDLPVLEIFVDLQCPACAKFEQASEHAIREALKADKIQVKYNIVSFLDSVGGGFSSKAGSSVVTVSQVEPEKFMDYISALFSVQPHESGKALYEDSMFGKIAVGLGLKDTTATRIQSFEYAQWVKDNVDVFANNPKYFKDGGFATPTVFYKGKQVEFDKGIAKTLEDMLK